MTGWDNLIPYNPHTKKIETYAERMYAGAESDRGYVWVANFKFIADLRFSGISRGQSAAHFLVDIENARASVGLPDVIGSLAALSEIKATLFMTDMLRLVQTQTIKHGLVEYARWTFCKRGSNFGITLAEEEDKK